MNEWIEVIQNTDGTDLQEMLAIIEDALSHGFIFKVENHKLYARMELNNT